MPDVGVPELLIILVVILLVFGPSKLADIGGSLGKGIREFRNAMKDDDEKPAVNPPAPPATTMPTTSETPAAPPAGQATEQRQ